MPQSVLGSHISSTRYTIMHTINYSYPISYPSVLPQCFLNQAYAGLWPVYIWLLYIDFIHEVCVCVSVCARACVCVHVSVFAPEASNN